MTSSTYPPVWLGRTVVALLLLLALGDDALALAVRRMGKPGRCGPPVIGRGRPGQRGTAAVASAGIDYPIGLDHGVLEAELLSLEQGPT